MSLFVPWRKSGVPAVLTAVATTVAVTLTGCTGIASGAQSPSSPSVAPATAPPSASAAAVKCGNPVASFAPTEALPQPGHMPTGGYLEQIQKRGHLIAGVSADTLLFGARNPVSGQIEGFDIDILHAVAKAIFGDPNKIEFQVITYANRIPSLLKPNGVDVVAHTMTINCARWAQIDFSSEYYHAGQRVLVRADSPAKSIDDLNGKRVCAATGSTNIINLAAHPKVIPVAVDDLTDCMVAFQQGTVDAVTADDTVLAGFADQDPYAHVIGAPFTSEPYGLAVSKKHPDLVRFLNGVLENVRRDQWKAIYTHWLGAVAPAPEPPRAVYGRTP